MLTFKCINENGTNVFQNASTRLRHKKKPGHLRWRKSTVEFIDEWWLGDAETNDEEYSKVYGFRKIPSITALISDNSWELIYFVKKEEKKFCENMISDSCGHTSSEGEKYFKGKYVQKARSKNSKQKAVPID